MRRWRSAEFPSTGASIHRVVPNAWDGYNRVMITLADIQRARERIHTVAIHTPLLPAKFGPANIYFKCENLQRGGAFKIRGAYNNLAQLAPEVRARGVTAYSSGNHAQAVALAAKLFDVPASIVMLNESVAEKVAQTIEYGAEVIFGGDSSEKIKLRAERIAAERGMTVIPPFDHAGTIAGQGTVGVEILEDLPEVQTVIVPIGGGGLISGIATAVKEIRPSIRVIGVEPEGAPTMYESLKAGELVTLPETNTIADGLKPLRAGDLTFAAVRRYVDDDGAGARLRDRGGRRPAPEAGEAGGGALGCGKLRRSALGQGRCLRPHRVRPFGRQHFQ